MPPPQRCAHVHVLSFLILLNATVVPHKKEEFVDTPYLTKRRVDRAFIKNITDLQGNPISAEYFGRSGIIYIYIYINRYPSITFKRERERGGGQRKDRSEGVFRLIN